MPLQNAICKMPFENATGKCNWKMPLENGIENANGGIGNFPPFICQKKEIGKGRWLSLFGHEASGKELAPSLVRCNLNSDSGEGASEGIRVLDTQNMRGGLRQVGGRGSNVAGKIGQRQGLWPPVGGRVFPVYTITHVVMAPRALFVRDRSIPGELAGATVTVRAARTGAVQRCWARRLDPRRFGENFGRRARFPPAIDRFRASWRVR